MAVSIRVPRRRRACAEKQLQPSARSIRAAWYHHGLIQIIYWWHVCIWAQERCDGQCSRSDVELDVVLHGYIRREIASPTLLASRNSPPGQDRYSETVPAGERA